MAIKITKSTDPITKNNLFVVLYGPPGSGKTSLAMTSGKCISLDFDAGAGRAVSRSDAIQVRSWDDVSGIEQTDLDNFDTVVIDTGGTMTDFAAQDIMRRNPKMARGGGQLSLQGFGELKGVVLPFIKQFRLWGKDVIMICHSKEERRGDDTTQRLLMQGSAVQDVMQMADAIGFVTRGKNFHQVSFEPDENAHSKSPVGSIAVMPIITRKEGQSGADMAELMKHMKDEINKKNAGSAEAAKEMAEATVMATEAKDLEQINAVIGKLAKSGAPAKKVAIAILTPKATALGAAFDTKAKAFVVPAQQEQTDDDEAQSAAA